MNRLLEGLVHLCFLAPIDRLLLVVIWQFRVGVEQVVGHYDDLLLVLLTLEVFRVLRLPGERAQIVVSDPTRGLLSLSGIPEG
jgi:hypothetical protein